VTFTSSNPTVVSLSGQANRSVVVTGVAAGTATITATTPGRTAPLTSQVPVTVRCRIQLGTPVPGSINDLFVGQQRTIQVTVTADPGCSNAVNWSSSATGVASVDQTGRVTGVGAGTATITIRSQQDQAISVSVPVTVLSVVSVQRRSAGRRVQDHHRGHQSRRRANRVGDVEPQRRVDHPGRCGHRRGRWHGHDHGDGDS
jgi:uncharacterized protein YjdB